MTGRYSASARPRIPAGRTSRRRPQIKLVVFDWAGTIVDHGCLAPIDALVSAFAERDVEVTRDEVRRHMGLYKRDHIRELLRIDTVTDRWMGVHGRPWTEDDVSALFEAFVPRQLEQIDIHATLIDGLLELAEKLRRRDIRIGTTTGYFDEAAAKVYARAREQGFEADHNVCADDVPTSRPAPWMVFENMRALDVFPPSSVIKVGDTVFDIEEGRNAGAWAVGVARTGSTVGLSATEWDTLKPRAQQAKLNDARECLLRAGAHRVIDHIADLPTLLESL